MPSSPASVGRSMASPANQHRVAMAALNRRGVQPARTVAPAPAPAPCLAGNARRRALRTLEELEQGSAVCAGHAITVRVDELQALDDEEPAP